MKRKYRTPKHPPPPPPPPPTNNNNDEQASNFTKSNNTMPSTMMTATATTTPPTTAAAGTIEREEKERKRERESKRERRREKNITTETHSDCLMAPSVRWNDSRSSSSSSCHHFYNGESEICVFSKRLKKIPNVKRVCVRSTNAWLGLPLHGMARSSAMEWGHIQALHAVKLKCSRSFSFFRFFFFFFVTRVRLPFTHSDTLAARFIRCVCTFVCECTPSLYAEPEKKKKENGKIPRNIAVERNAERPLWKVMSIWWCWSCTGVPAIQNYHRRRWSMARENIVNTRAREERNEKEKKNGKFIRCSSSLAYRIESALEVGSNGIAHLCTNNSQFSTGFAWTLCTELDTDDRRAAFYFAWSLYVCSL